MPERCGGVWCAGWCTTTAVFSIVSQQVAFFQWPSSLSTNLSGWITSPWHAITTEDGERHSNNILAELSSELNPPLKHFLRNINCSNNFAQNMFWNSPMKFQCVLLYFDFLCFTFLYVLYMFATLALTMKNIKMFVFYIFLIVF